MPVLRVILLPLSWLYALVLRMRHSLFDHGFLESVSPRIKTIVIGNLEFGGTGKSPHTAWVADVLGSKDLAILSRGHGRTSVGFISVETDSEAEQVGDEPLMLKRALPGFKVAVCEERVIGVEELASEGFKKVILDDAFQHRQMKGGMNILLTSHSLPFWSNQLVPSGTLRDVKSRAKAADILVITKCAGDISRSEMDTLRAQARRFTSAHVYFSKMVYGLPENIFEEGKPWRPSADVLAVAGLAHNDTFFSKVAETIGLTETLSFPDHHAYTEKDIDTIRKRISTFVGPQKAVLTTSKDAVKLGKGEWKEMLKDLDIYSLPMKVEIIIDEQQFITELKTYVK